MTLLGSDPCRPLHLQEYFVGNSGFLTSRQGAKTQGEEPPSLGSYGEPWPPSLQKMQLFEEGAPPPASVHPWTSEQRQLPANGVDCLGHLRKGQHPRRRPVRAGGRKRPSAWCWRPAFSRANLRSEAALSAKATADKTVISQPPGSRWCG